MKILSVGHHSSAKELNDAIERFKKLEVLVGIPKGKAREGKTPIANFELGYIHEKGSPAANIPARPFLRPGVHEQEKKIARGLRAALKSALDGNPQAGEARLEALGLSVAAGVKSYMTTADFVPLKRQTIINRHRNRGTKPRENEKPYIMKDGKKVPNPDFGVGIKPLIDTGELRRSIDSFVITGE